MNVCDHSAIYGLDGTPWATYPDFALLEYHREQLQDDGSYLRIRVHEFNDLLAAIRGYKSFKVLRMADKEYGLVRRFDDVIYLARKF